MNELAKSTRAKVFAMEAAIKSELEPVVITPVHHFSPGVYAREIFIPKGTVCTGEIHKYAQLNIMSKGDLSVLTEDGIVRVQAPFTVVSPPGTKRVAYAHEDTVWTTILHTDETEVLKIEDHFIAKTEDEYIAFEQKLLECHS